MKKQDDAKISKFKGLSKAVLIISNILKVLTIIGAICMLIGVFAIPYILKSAKIDEKSISFNDTKIVEFDSEESAILENNTELMQILKKFTKDVNVRDTIAYYCAIESVRLIILTFVFHYLGKLFGRFNKEDSPFKEDNVPIINKLAFSLLFYICIPVLISGIVEMIIDTDLNFSYSIIEILFLLIIFAFRYIIEYGCSLEKNR